MGDGASKLYLKNILSSMSSGFTDIKNVISGINTKVDGISTNLTGLGTDLRTEIGKSYLDLENIIYKEGVVKEANKNQTLLSVTGSGELYLVSALAGANSGSITLDITIDSLNLHLYVGSGKGESAIFCSDVFKGATTYGATGGYYYTIFGALDRTGTSPNIKNYDLQKPTGSSGNTTTMYISRTPIKFNKSLKISAGNVYEDYNGYKVAYKLY